MGDQVVAAMRRVAQGQEFRSNVHRGGLTEKVELDNSYKEIAIIAAKLIALVSPVLICWKEKTVLKLWKLILLQG